MEQNTREQRIRYATNLARVTLATWQAQSKFHLWTGTPEVVEARWKLIQAEARRLTKEEL